MVQAQAIPESQLTTPERLSASFAEVARSVEKAVVSIEAKGRIPNPNETGGEPKEGEDILEFFRRQMPRRAATSVGSGFIVDPAGYIITNAHVVDESTRIKVKLGSGEEYIAEVVGSDEETDIAVLKIDAGKDLPVVKMGDSARAQVGDWVLAMGSPFGLAKTVTAGIVSQTLRETPYASAFQKFIQTDASINRGNSGGPLVNMNGEVIGVNSQIATSTGDSNGIGFALPSNEAEYVYRSIKADGHVRRGYMGAILDSVKVEYAKVYGLKEAKGAIVTEIRDPAAAAAAAGLQAGDVITEFNGIPVESAQDLIAKVAATAPKTAVSITYLREVGTELETRTAKLTLGERPNSAVKSSSGAETRKMPVDKAAVEPKPFGLTVVELNAETAKTYNAVGQKGVLVKDIDPASFIADMKAANGSDAIGEGDVIQRINRDVVTSISSFTTAAAKLKKGDPVVLHIKSFIPATRSLQLKVVQFTVQ